MLNSIWGNLMTIKKHVLVCVSALIIKGWSSPKLSLDHLLLKSLNGRAECGMPGPEKIGKIEVTLVAGVKSALSTLSQQPWPKCLLTFSDTETKHSLTNDGIPQLNVDQLNSRNMFQDFFMPEDAIHKPTATICWDGGVFNYVSLAMKLTLGQTTQRLGLEYLAAVGIHPVRSIRCPGGVWRPCASHRWGSCVQFSLDL